MHQHAYFAHGSGARLLHIDPREYIMAMTDELFARRQRVRLGEVTDTRTLGLPKACECKAAEWTAWQ